MSYSNARIITELIMWSEPYTKPILTSLHCNHIIYTMQFLDVLLFFSFYSPLVFFPFFCFFHNWLFTPCDSFIVMRFHFFTHRTCFFGLLHYSHVFSWFCVSAFSRVATRNFHIWTDVNLIIDTAAFSALLYIHHSKAVGTIGPARRCLPSYIC